MINVILQFLGLDIFNIKLSAKFYQNIPNSLIVNFHFFQNLNLGKTLTNPKWHLPKEAILSSPLFYNHEINIGGKPLWIKNWYTNGIRYVNDLLIETGDFYSQAILERTYNIKTNFIQFQGIKQALKLYGRRFNIRNFTKQLLCPIIPANITLITKSRKGGKDFYTILNKNEDKPTSQAKWEKIYSIEEETWKIISYSPFQIFIGTKLQWFQIRINHRILPTKKFLYTIKYIQSPNCNFCQEEETINHMFWNCQESQSLTREFSR